MVKIDFVEPNTDDWIQWREKCITATSGLIDTHNNGDKPIIDNNLYKECKSYYFDLSGLFNGKCVYCESLIAADQPGDVEHYRPKGRVTDKNNKVIQLHNGDPHPGYFWLAYSVRNLLPSCEDCNRPSKQKSKGKLIGKWDKFPVSGFRASVPGDEDKEDDLLINPMIENPDKHLKIDDTGIMVGVTPQGKKCVDVFGLNDRTALVEARKEAYEATKDLFYTYINCIALNSPNTERKKERLSKIHNGIAPYSKGGRIAIQTEREKVKKGIDVS